jgi:hypothetical protein
MSSFVVAGRGLSEKIKVIEWVLFEASVFCMMVPDQRGCDWSIQLLLRIRPLLFWLVISIMSDYSAIPISSQ